MIGSQKFVEVVRSILSEQPLDIVMVDSLMHLFGNLTGSGSEYRKIINSHFDLPEVMIKILNSNLNNVPNIFAKNYIWVAKNLSEDAKKLTKLQK